MLHNYSHVFVQFNVMSGRRGCPSRPHPPPAPRPTTFGEWIRRMQIADLDDLLDPPPMEMRSMDDEFNNLANDIDVCT